MIHFCFCYLHVFLVGRLFTYRRVFVLRVFLFRCLSAGQQALEVVRIRRIFHSLVVKRNQIHQLTTRFHTKTKSVEERLVLLRQIMADDDFFDLVVRDPRLVVAMATLLYLQDAGNIINLNSGLPQIEMGVSR